MSGTPATPSYRDLLERALAMGRADGLLAVAVEPRPGEESSTRCRGRDAAAFAGLIWGSAAGPPPAGLEVNAPLWYAQGFREALAGARIDPTAPPLPRPATSSGPTSHPDPLTPRP